MRPYDSSLPQGKRLGVWPLSALTRRLHDSTILSVPAHRLIGCSCDGEMR